MKKTINILILMFSIGFLLTGCYTIVWDPREEYPNEDNYTESDGFYESDYYGGYVDYYESPWWITTPIYVVYPGGDDNPTTKDRNNGRSSDTESIRNSNGRGNTDRNPDIITTPVTTTNSGNSNNSNNGNTTTPKRDSNSENTSSSSSSSDTRSSGSNDTRNSSGSRNSGSGRR